jgi:hypothetical protein
VRLHADEQREGAVLQLHHHALERLLRLFHRHLEEAQNDRLVLAQHFAGGDAKNDGVTDLAGCAGDRDSNGGLAHGNLQDERVGRNPAGGGSAARLKSVAWQ